MRGKSRNHNKARVILIAIGLLLILFAQISTSIPRLSITFDEPVHILTGYSILRTGDLRLVEDHPPLLEMWEGWPLLLDPTLPHPTEIPTWEDAERRHFAHHETWWTIPIDSWLIPARVTTALLSMLLGAILFRWASDWFGSTAGLIALLLLAFDPNLIAHGQLATLDLGVTCFIFSTMYTFQRCLRRPTLGRTLIAGFTLGLSLAAKVSAVILVPIALGLKALYTLIPQLRYPTWASQRPPSDLQDSSKLRKHKSHYLCIPYLCVAGIVLWATHLFQIKLSSTPPYVTPAPTYWASLLRVFTHVTTENRPGFLYGQSYMGGRWDYFPIAFLIKSPIPALLLCVAAVVSFVLRPLDRRRLILLISFPLVYSVFSISSAMNIGYRHILPVLPFVYLFIARFISVVLQAIDRSKRLYIQGLIMILALWQGFGTLLVWPFHLTYFNEIAGGPKNGYRWLTDSNVDWGQGLKALSEYLHTHAVQAPKLSSFTHYLKPEEVYDIPATPLPPQQGAPAILPQRFNPAPGDYIISASTLRGIHLTDPEMYNWFWHQEPDEVIANALLYYHVDAATQEPTWIAQCNQPVNPVPPDIISKQFGVEKLRMLSFDCTQSWIYPNGGQDRGWYVLHRDISSPPTPLTEAGLASTQLNFEQKTPGITPPLTIYEHVSTPAVPQQNDQVIVSPAEWPVAQTLQQGHTISLPVTLDHTLSFIGYTVYQAQDQLDILGYWMVEQAPSRPFSIMAHIINAAGQPIAVGDGLGIDGNQLQVGDLMIQKHTFTIPEDPEFEGGVEYWLQTGAYWLDTMEKFTIVFEGSPVGDRLLLITLGGKTS